MVKVEIGGGILPRKGFINLDYMKHPLVDHSLDLNKDTFPFEDNTVDEIYSNHCLEHLNPGYNGFLHCIEEMWRISKPDTRWYIRVPYCNSHHTQSNPFHTNNIFNEYTFYYFSDTPKFQINSNVGIRKGSCFEYDLKATLIIDKIEFEFFDNWSFLKNSSLEEIEVITHNNINVVNNIAYHLRVEKPDFWTKEYIRNATL